MPSWQLISVLRHGTKCNSIAISKEANTGHLESNIQFLPNKQHWFYILICVFMVIPLTLWFSIQSSFKYFCIMHFHAINDLF